MKTLLNTKFITPVFSRRRHWLLGPPHGRRAAPLQALRLSASRSHLRRRTVPRLLSASRAASSCLELSKRTDQSARCEQRRHIDCWRRLAGEYLLVGGPVNNILVIRQHFSEKYTRSCIKVATCVVFLVLTSTEDLEQVWSSLHYSVHTRAQSMCLCPDDLHYARMQRKRPFW